MPAPAIPPSPPYTLTPAKARALRISPAPITLRTPDALDDTTLGYGVGSQWLRIDTGETWTALRVTAGNAVWQKTGNPMVHVLDSVTTAAAAYGVVRLRKAYAGSAFQVRRASDLAVLDCGFVANPRGGPHLADFSAADAFCAGTTGTFSKWYDQSGAGLDATSAAIPPQLTNNLVNGMRAITMGQSTPGGMSFNLPAGLATARSNFSVVAVQYTPGFTAGASPQITLGSDASIANNACPDASTATFKATFQNPSYPSFQTLPCDLAVQVITSGATATNCQINESASGAKGALTAQAMTGGQIGFTGGGYNHQFWGEVMVIIVYERELTGAETIRAKNWAYPVFRIAPQVVDQLVLCGDSKTAGASTDPAMPWARQMLDYVTRPYRVYNFGLFGTTTAQWVSTYMASLAVPIFRPGVKNVMLIELGTNDIAGGVTAAAIYANLTAMVAAARAGGYTEIGVGTVLPFIATLTGPQIEAVRVPLNALILANSAGATFVYDPAGDPTMGLPANVSDASIMSGNLHPTAKGAAFQAPINAAAVNSRG